MLKVLHSGASGLLLAALLWGAPGPAGAAPVTEKVTSGQREAALEFLQAVASGDPQAVAFAIHPDDLQALRLRILNLLRDEAKRGDATIRSRLFGQGMPLEDIERLTSTGFYATLAYKFYLTGREYAEVDGLAAIPDKGDHVQVVVRGRQPRDHGKVQVVNVVTLRPYGKDWKASLAKRNRSADRRSDRGSAYRCGGIENAGALQFPGEGVAGRLPRFLRSWSCSRTHKRRSTMASATITTAST